MANRRISGMELGHGLVLSLIGLIALAAFSLVHIMQGEASLTAGRVFQALFRFSGETEDHIVWTLRLPRTVIGILAGGALAVAGALLQGLLRNPLADAGTLGINAGSYFVLVAATVFAPQLASSFSLLLTLAGGAGAGFFAYLLSGGPKSTPLRMALAGMIVSFTLSAFTGALQLMYENVTQGLFLWGSGTLVQIDWSGVSYAWPWVLAGLAGALALSRSLDTLALGEETAVSLGQNLKRIRGFGLLTAVLLSSITVSVVGPIGFIGLVAPHLMRMMGCTRHRLLIPACFIWGGVLVVASDTVAMMFRSSLGQLPVGAVTALIGGPWLIWLAAKAVKGRAGEVPKASVQGQSSRLKHVPYAGWVAALSALLLAMIVFGQAFGSLRLPALDVLSMLWGEASEMTRNLVMKLRLPRTLVAALAGAALALSGLLIQGVVRNPLADPSIIGITSGAGVGVLLMLTLFPQLGGLLPLAALIGAVATAAVVYAFSRSSGLQPAVLTLVGMAVSAIAGALIQVMVIQSKLTASAALVWLSGSTYARGWAHIPTLAVGLAVLLPLAWLLARRLDILQFNDDTTMGVGLVPSRTRLAIGAVGAGLAALAVCTVGSVGFIGLIAPHAVRMMAGPNHRKLVPLAVLLGASLLVLADLLGRTVMAPREIPAGLVVALIGGPYFLWLMYASGRRSPISRK